MKAFILGFIFLIPFSAEAKPKVVYFKTSDGWKIAADFQAPSKNKPVAILIHGAASARSEWHKLSERLWKMGWGTLALDLRGHGKSLAGPKGKTDFKNFDATGDWIKARRDLEAAVEFLKKKKIDASRMGFIGASIGANLASQAAGLHDSMRWVVLLSPGFDYRGVAVAQGLSGKKVILGASPGDFYAFQTVSKIMPSYGQHYFLQTGRGHGAQLLDDPDLVNKLLKLLTEF